MLDTGPLMEMNVYTKRDPDIISKGQKVHNSNLYHQVGGSMEFTMPTEGHKVKQGLLPH